MQRATQRTKQRERNRMTTGRSTVWEWSLLLMNERTEVTRSRRWALRRGGSTPRHPHTERRSRHTPTRHDEQGPPPVGPAPAAPCVGGGGRARLGWAGPDAERAGSRGRSGNNAATGHCDRASPALPPQPQNPPPRQQEEPRTGRGRRVRRKRELDNTTREAEWKRGVSAAEGWAIPLLSSARASASERGRGT